jgi:hypothetical protein
VPPQESFTIAPQAFVYLIFKNHHSRESSQEGPFSENENIDFDIGQLCLMQRRDAPSLSHIEQDEILAVARLLYFHSSP